jgi:hypothetical protein
MNNILLALAIVSAAAVWRHFDFWIPRAVPVSLQTRRRALVAAGCGVLLLAGGFSVGDIIGGRTQVARTPVQYATRLTGAAAHHHDLANPALFWRQVALQIAGALFVGGSLLALSRVQSGTPQRSPNTHCC